MSAKKPTGVYRRHGRACPGTATCPCPWAYSVELPAGGDGKRRHLTKSGFPTQRAAKEARADVVKAHRDGFLEGDRKVTTGDYLERWLTGKTDTERPIRPTTARSYRQHLDSYLLPHLGPIRLVHLRPADVERMLAAIRREHPRVSAVTRLRVLATLRSALTSAVRRDMIPANPCTRVELPTGERYRVKPWEPGETARFLDHPEVIEHRLYPLVRLAALSGLRRGELVGLRWVDVDLDRRVLVVVQQIVQVGHELHTGRPKTENGAGRTVDLDADTTALLRSWRARQTGERLAWGEVWTDTNLVFTREDGTGWHPESVTKAFRRLCRRAGVRVIRLHDLRHTAASLQLAGGVPLEVISKRLGHGSVGITSAIYSHVIGDLGSAAAEAGADVLRRAGGGR